MSTKLPKDLEEKVKRAKEIEAELRKAEKILNGEEPEPEQPEPGQEPGTDQPGDTGTPEQQEPPEQQQQDQQKPEQQEPEQQPTQSQEDQKPALNEEAEHWRIRFINYKKSTDQTIYNLRQENKALTEAVNLLKAKVKTLEEQAKQLDEIQKSTLSEKLKSELGDDTASVINEYITKVVEPLQKENELLKQQLEGVQNITTEAATGTQTQRVADKLRQMMPYFDLVDNDPRFLQYIEYLDPYSQKPIKMLIQEAIKTENLRYLYDVYTDFYNLLVQQQQQAQGQNPQQPPIKNPFSQTEEAPPKKEEIEKRTGVAGTSGADVAPEQSKRIWTKEAIKQFYVDKALRRISPEDAKKLEADIQRAYKEGRIRG